MFLLDKNEQVFILLNVYNSEQMFLLIIVYEIVTNRAELCIYNTILPERAYPHEQKSGTPNKQVLIIQML